MNTNGIKAILTALLTALLIMAMAGSAMCTPDADRKASHEEEKAIKAIQKAIDEKGLNWTAGVTSVSNLTKEEKQNMCGVKPEKAPKVKKEKKDKKPDNVGTFPDSFDWRDVDGKDWMTPVKSQGSCGSCWAFSAIGVVEAAINIYANNPDMDIDLAEQHLVSDCYYAGDCTDGWPAGALEYIRDNGVPEESCFPYTASNCACTPCAGWDDNPWKITNYKYIYAATLKSGLQEYGPLSVVLTAPDDWFYYVGGVYSPAWEDTNGVGWANHAVVLVGWDDADGCWIVKNSYSANWGENGYGRVLYGDLEQYQYQYAVTGIDNAGTWYKPLYATASSWWGNPSSQWFPDSPPEYAIDYDSESCWVAYYNDPAAWLQFDLADGDIQVRDVNGICVHPRIYAGRDYQMIFSVQVYMDGDWETVVDEVIIDPEDDFVEVLFPCVETRYIKLVETDNFVRSFRHCAEFEASIIG